MARSFAEPWRSVLIIPFFSSETRTECSDPAGVDERPAPDRRGSGLAFEPAGEEGPREPPARARGGISAYDLAALHDSLEHIRQAQRILIQARTPEA